jgi:hypothetical protein
MIKIFASLFVCCLLSSTFLFAQSADEKAVADATENLRKAMLASDKTVLENLTVDELSYGHSTGLIQDKATFVDDIISKKSIYKSISIDNQTIKIAGDNAIVRHHMTGEIVNPDITIRPDLIVLMVWKKRKGQWKLLARQAAKIPPAAK